MALSVGVRGCYETRFAFLAVEEVSQNSSAGGTLQSSPARSRTGVPEPRRICAGWVGRRSAGSSGKFIRVPFLGPLTGWLYIF